MPITVEDFTRGKKFEPLTLQIQNFLRKNNDLAFTWDELFRHLFPYQKKKFAYVIMGIVALSQLTSSNIVEARRIKGGEDAAEDEERTYYRINQELV